MCIVGTSQAAPVIASDPYNLRQRVIVSTSGTSYTLDDNGPYNVGPGYFADGNIQDENNILIPFDLTGVDTITAATFFSQPNFVFDSPLSYNIDLYGVGYSADADTLPDTSANLFFLGASDGSATAIQFGYLTHPVTVDSYTGSAGGATETGLISYLNARPVGMDVVWLRLNPDASVAYVGPTGNETYSVRFDPTGIPPWDGINDGVPYLEITAVPEPGTSVLVGLGLFGVLCGIRRLRA